MISIKYDILDLFVVTKELIYSYLRVEGLFPSSQSLGRPSQMARQGLDHVANCLHLVSITLLHHVVIGGHFAQDHFEY